MKRNKLIFTGFLTIVILLAVSCEKIGKKDYLIGQWEVVKLEVFVLSGEDLVSQGTYPPEIHIMEFKEDGTLVVYYDPNDLGQFENYTWAHTTDPVEEGDTITIDGDEVTIESLSERTLVFSVWESSTDLLEFTLRKVE